MTTVRQTVWRMACAGFYLLCCASCDDDSVAAPDGHTPPSESDVLDVSSWEDVASGEGEADGSGPDIDSPESFPWACNTVAPPPATPAPTGSPGDGAFYGRVLDDTCAPLYDSVEDEGFSVLACTDSNCVTGKTASDGTYHLTGLPTGPHKMQLLGAPHGYPTLVWYQDAVAGEVVALSRDIVVPPVGAEWVAPDDSGSVSIGSVTLEAAAYQYDIGEGPELNITELPISMVPVYNISPWDGRESESRVFIINPFKTSVSEGYGTLSVTGMAGDAGARYDVFSADSLTATLEYAGTGTLNAEGILISDDDCLLKELNAIILVPTDD